MEHPARAGAAVALTAGYGEQAREELGPVPDYYSSLVPINTEGNDAMIANLASVNPLGAAADIAATLSEQVNSFRSGEPVGTFRSLAGFLSPPADMALQLVRGQGEFGEAASTRTIISKAAPEFVPFWGTYQDIVDETKPASQLDQGIGATLGRRIVRFSPQRMNMSILNQQAKDRGEEPVTSKLAAAREKARSSWSYLMPGDHMPRQIEDSIKAYYMVQANRALLKEEIKSKYRASWQPTKREPTLSLLQETAIVYDVAAAVIPGFTAEEAPEPIEVLDQYGEEALDKYKSNLEKALYSGKRKADEANRRAAKGRKQAAA